jgi:YbbR domain-containing protein
VKQFLRRYILHNLPYKITALLLAGIFWYIVQGEEILEINRKIHVHLEVPENLLIKGNKIRIKDATISGPRLLLAQTSTFPLEATVRIPSNKTGKLRIRLDKEYIKNWNSKLKLVIHDAYIQVVVDEKQTRILAIKEQLQGVPGDGFIIEKAAIEPDKVIITGMKEDIARLNKIVTEPIDVAGIHKSTSFEVPLNTTGIAPAQLSVEKVKVDLQVGEKKVNRQFANIPIDIEEKVLPSRVRPAAVSIIVQGTPGVLNAIKDADLSAFISVRELLPGRYEKKVQVKIPPDTVLIETSPTTVEVTIGKK